VDEVDVGCSSWDGWFGWIVQLSNMAVRSVRWDVLRFRWLEIRSVQVQQLVIIQSASDIAKNLNRIYNYLKVVL
jgi:hypothetical protein